MSQVVDARLCPVCPDERGEDTWVEPEFDADHSYYECPECGYAWGWELVGEDGSGSSDVCAAGFTEEQRSSFPKADLSKPGQVNMGMTIGKRPGL